MVLSELIDRTLVLLRLVSSKSPKHATEAGVLGEELSRLKGWAYPHLTTEDLQQVVRCKKCQYYKKYKKKGDPKAAPFYACSKTKLKRQADFYCAEGKRR